MPRLPTPPVGLTTDCSKAVVFALGVLSGALWLLAAGLFSSCVLNNPDCCLIVVFSGSCLALRSPLWGRGAYIVALLPVDL